MLNAILLYNLTRVEKGLNVGIFTNYTIIWTINYEYRQSIEANLELL